MRIYQGNLNIHKLREEDIRLINGKQKLSISYNRDRYESDRIWLTGTRTGLTYGTIGFQRCSNGYEYFMEADTGRFNINMNRLDQPKYKELFSRDGNRINLPLVVAFYAESKRDEDIAASIWVPGEHPKQNMLGRGRQDKPRTATSYLNSLKSI